MRDPAAVPATVEKGQRMILSRSDTETMAHGARTFVEALTG